MSLPLPCPCGQKADPSQISLHQTFPRLYPVPLCAPCAHAADLAHQAEQSRRIQTEAHAKNFARYLATIPPEMRDTDPTHPHFNAALYSQISAWTPAHPWLGVYGEPGACKTRSIALLAKHLILQGHHLTWTTATKIQTLLAQTWNGTPSEKRDASRTIATYSTTDILVLDDIGKNTWTPTMESTLFQIIDHRKTHYLPLLWSANEHPEEILKTSGISPQIGGPLLGRLLEASTLIEA